MAVVRGRLPPHGRLQYKQRRKYLPEAPASGEERTSWPASVESWLFLPNPKDAEIFTRENKTIKNSQIIVNIS